MRKLAANSGISALLLILSHLLIFSDVNCELFIIDNKLTNQTNDSWFNIDLLKEFLSDENASSVSVDIFENFGKMISFSQKAPSEKSNSWIPQNLNEVLSRIKSNSNREEIKSEPILQRKFTSLKNYLERLMSMKTDTRNKELDKKDKINSFFSLEFGRKNKTRENEESRTNRTQFINSPEKQISDTKTGDFVQINNLKEVSSQSTQMASNLNANLECEKNVISNFKECIEKCKNNLKQIQTRTGGITPMNLSELNTCIHSCRQIAMNSANCKLSIGSLNLINEEIPIPKPTIRRFQKNEERSRSLIHIYIIEPIIRLVTMISFCLIGVIVILYYFKEHRLYPRFADYVTFKIESYYTEDEKRRAIFEGDSFPQQPKNNWKRTLVYVIRLNFLPRFFANNFTWLIPMRDHYQQSTETSNYVRVQ